MRLWKPRSRFAIAVGPQGDFGPPENYAERCFGVVQGEVKQLSLAAAPFVAEQRTRHTALRLQELS